MRGRIKRPKDRVNAIYLCHYKEITCHYIVSKTYLLVTILYSDMSLLGTCHYKVLSLYSMGFKPYIQFTSLSKSDLIDWSVNVWS